MPRRNCNTSKASYKSRNDLAGNDVEKYYMQHPRTWRALRLPYYGTQSRCIYFSECIRCFNVFFRCFNVCFTCFNVCFTCFNVYSTCFNVRFRCFNVCFRCFDVCFICFNVYADDFELIKINRKKNRGAFTRLIVTDFFCLKSTSLVLIHRLD